MGHQTTGLEVLGQFSAADFNDAAHSIGPITEKICKLLKYDE